MASVPNTIKVKQIDNDDLRDFVLSLLGATGLPGEILHLNDEYFLGAIYTNGPLVNSGSLYVSGNAVFQSGLTANSGITVNGLISGQTLAIQTFNVQAATFQTINIGSMSLTGVPIYESGNVGAAVLLPSGTVYGLKQQANAPTWEYDPSGQLMPATGLGVSYVQLCVSIGS